MVLMAMTSCGGIGSTVVTSGPRYTVNASLMQKPGSEPVACNVILSSLPPAGCGGVVVHGLEIETLPGLTRYGNGLMHTKAYSDS